MIEHIVLRGQRPRLGRYWFILSLTGFFSVMVSVFTYGLATDERDAGFLWGIPFLLWVMAIWSLTDAAKLLGWLRIATVSLDGVGYQVRTPLLRGLFLRRPGRKGERVALTLTVTDVRGLPRYLYQFVQADSRSLFISPAPITKASARALVEAFARHGTPLEVQRSILAAPANPGRTSRKAKRRDPADAEFLSVQPGTPDTVAVATPGLALHYAPIIVQKPPIDGHRWLDQGDALRNHRAVETREAPQVALTVAYEPPHGYERFAKHDFRGVAAALEVLDADDTPLVLIETSTPISGVDVYVRDGAISEVYFHVHAAS